MKDFQVRDKFLTARQFDDEYQWAERNGYRESTGALCEHALIVGRCARKECDLRAGLRPRFLDHARLWLYPDGRRFILAHVYDWDLDKELDADAWATASELSWATLYPDGWYGAHTTPVRFWFEKDLMFRLSRHLRPAAIQRLNGRWVDLSRLAYPLGRRTGSVRGRNEIRLSNRRPN